MEDKIKTEEFQKIMADILEGYEKLENKQDLDTYLQEKLKEYGVGESDEERNSIISKFGITLRAIADKFKSIVSFKNKGKSNAQWLNQDLEKSMEGLEEEDKTIILGSVNKALKETKNEHLKILEKSKKMKEENNN